MPPISRFLTGLVNLAIVDARKIPGKNLFFWDFLAVEDSFSSSHSYSPSSCTVGGKNAISNVFGTLLTKSSLSLYCILSALSALTNLLACVGSTYPRTIPSKITGRYL